jgi:1-acyl-sn-glycerol-3-phosphate acyltransferase
MGRTPEHGGGYFPRNEAINRAVRVLEYHYVSEVLVLGTEHLETVRQHRKKKIPTIFFPNHLSNVDGPTLDRAWRTHGYEDIADDAVYFLGQKLRNGSITNVLTQATHRIPVWPKSLPAQGNEKALRKNMNEQAGKTARKILQQGRSMVLFPEGGRSRTHTLGEPVDLAAIYLTMVDETLVAPVGISGTDAILDVGERIPKRHLGFRPIVEFGDPFLVKKENLLVNGRPSRELMARQMGKIMDAIADCLPPRYKGMRG